ncbi:hypothetical protein C2869_01055 [Saccharobesus litoralis]|uniref:Methyltransferase domain-containing protein n=1 Tax=Saccharobesus litoralis TaxID=2172099 RepID=A0A2S0VLM4_9ALTE|nr:class I SAM-dependent methyltransferase [Saccharobesus litoralis]AWB65114.1 hypothetical protein C2869_01055 [Saccharobesus litoralis]
MNHTQQLAPTSMKTSDPSFSFKGIKFVKPNHHRVQNIKINNDSPRYLANKVWISSFLMMDYLSSLSLPKGQKIQEIGCGWGAISTYVGKQFNVKVCASDVDKNAQPYQALLNEVNGVNIGFSQASFADMARQANHNLDMLLGADICYNPNTQRELIDLISAFMNKPNRQVILADIGRTPFMRLYKTLESRLTANLTLIQKSLSLPTQIDGYVLHIIS